MNYARVFLSHASANKDLVTAVADALARRGIIAWLDIHDLYPSLDLTQALTRAVREHTLLAAFLSEEAVRSPWVDRELMVALAQEDSARGDQSSPAVMPVFLGEPLDLVRKHPRLRSRWMHADGDGVNRLGIPASAADLDRAPEIADKIARTVYQHMGLVTSDDVALILDQRGGGMRTGLPEFIPRNVEDLDIPALVFRPNLGQRSHGETLRGQAWDALCGDMVNALDRALGPRRPTPRKLRILGASQLALPFLLGLRLDRTYGAALYAYDRAGMPLGIDLADFDVPLTGGTPDCAQMDERLARLPQARPGTRSESLVLLVLKDGHGYLERAVDFLEARDNTPPVAWIPHLPEFRSSDEVVSLARDIKACVDQVGARAVEILTSLPFHVLPLLGALLSPHVFARVTFLEYDRNATDARDGYLSLPLP